MQRYEVKYIENEFTNWTYFDNKTSAYDFACKHKPSVVLFKRKKIREFK